MSMKVICIHHRLASFSSHHFNEAHGFMLEFGWRGKELVVLANVQAQPRIVAELKAHAVLDDPTFRLEWSFEERSRRFLDMLHRQVDRFVKAGDCVLLTVSTQLEAHALTRWLGELPRRKKPWIVILFLSDRWNRSGPEEYERQIAEFRKLSAAISALIPEDSRRVIFCTLTDLLAEELSELLGTKVEVAPIPLDYGDPRVYGSVKPASPLPRVAILGGTRREKGSHLIPDIIRACRSDVQVEFMVHLTNNTLTAEEIERLSLIAEEPRVSVIREALPLEGYKTALDSADIALFPYEVIPYRKRPSGVFAEAVAYGKPVVATPGTWMAEQIRAGRAAGTISEDLRPDSIARAVAQCVADLGPLQRSAQALSFEWRRRASLSAFVDFVETQIALRSHACVVPSGSEGPGGVGGTQPLR
jgi:glycosyltransferase involved in cell wall biosynthesis